jgi:hypothetical protein
MLLKKLLNSANQLKSARPTAVNLEWAVNKQLAAIAGGKLVNEKIRLPGILLFILPAKMPIVAGKLEHGAAIIALSKNKKAR